MAFAKILSQLMIDVSKTGVFFWPDRTFIFQRESDLSRGSKPYRYPRTKFRKIR